MDAAADARAGGETGLLKWACIGLFPLNNAGEVDWPIASIPIIALRLSFETVREWPGLIV